MNNIEYVVHKLNLGSHCQLIQINKTKWSSDQSKVQVINCINVKPKSEKRLGLK